MACAWLLVACSGGGEASPTAAAKPVLSPIQAHGQELYGRMCKVCHGADGEGYKADNAPMLKNQEYLASVADAQLFDAIERGRAGTPMSAWSVKRGGPLAPADTTALIAFLRSWQTVPPAKLDERPAAGDAARGGVYFERECKSCHGEQGKTGPMVRIGDPELLKYASNGFLRHAIVKGRPGTQMQAFEAKLGADAVEDLVTYLRSLQHAARDPHHGHDHAQHDPHDPHAGHDHAQPPAPPLPLPEGKVVLNPKGGDPNGFVAHPGTTPIDVIAAELKRGARMVIMDARASSDYTSEHIQGAVSVPFYDPSPYLDKLPKDTWLVSYCACPHAASKELAGKLQAAGFKKVTVLDEGIGVWKQKGHAVTSAAAQ
jgi:cytochrome c oxidase cbb3-type subunit III